jgi:hypothetical protein
MPALVVGLALQLGGRCWAAAEVDDLPFDQAVKQLNSFDAATTASATTALPAPPVITEEAAPAVSEDESGPADGCAPSLAGEGFFSRFKDTYEDLLFNYWKDPSNYPAYMANEGKPVPTPADQPPAYRGAPPQLDEPPFAYSTSPLAQLIRSVTRLRITQPMQLL